MATPPAQLSTAQRALLEQWLPDARVVRDHSWGLVDNIVLELESGGDRFIMKADGAMTQHIERELDAHAKWLSPWLAIGRAPRLVAGDREAKILLTAHLPGELVLGTSAQEDPETFRQAGQLLAMLHAQARRTDASYEAQENAKLLRNLDKEHRIAPRREAQLRDIVSSWTADPVVLVPTHGDWQPRNWLVHEGRISVIDFGRSAMRPAVSDWLRLEARDFRADPARERAFVEGYGADPREPGAWFRERLREAINTAIWAHLVGDEAFEAQGHEMIERALATHDA
ncbi:MAG TPA: phosphotransferase [Flexivirga sp.]|uniref:phosphotransferase n=1 Tax=Flexivirga sp. TaxID=1962927 RepID=UPI002C98F31C|nr:phosphotransferase [Flexivirga sp.]HWC22474.1 phosphotransferase [Flexivirga sp.]